MLSGSDPFKTTRAQAYTAAADAGKAPIHFTVSNYAENGLPYSTTFYGTSPSMAEAEAKVLRDGLSNYVTEESQKQLMQDLEVAATDQAVQDAVKAHIRRVEAKLTDLGNHPLSPCGMSMASTVTYQSAAGELRQVNFSVGNILIAQSKPELFHINTLVPAQYQSHDDQAWSSEPSDTLLPKALRAGKTAQIASNQIIDRPYQEGETIYFIPDFNLEALHFMKLEGQYGDTPVQRLSERTTKNTLLKHIESNGLISEMRSPGVGVVNAQKDDEYVNRAERFDKIARETLACKIHFNQKRAQGYWGERANSIEGLFSIVNEKPRGFFARLKNWWRMWRSGLSKQRNQVRAVYQAKQSYISGQYDKVVAVEQNIQANAYKMHLVATQSAASMEEAVKTIEHLMNEAHYNRRAAGNVVNKARKDFAKSVRKNRTRYTTYQGKRYESIPAVDLEAQANAVRDKEATLAQAMLVEHGLEEQLVEGKTLLRAYSVEAEQAKSTGEQLVKAHRAAHLELDAVEQMQDIEWRSRPA